MIEYGIVHSVQIVTLGSRLAADAAPGATSLVVDNASDFNGGGGTLSLNGTQYAYTAVAFDTDTITLAAGLTAAAAASDRVDVWPLTPEKYALVVVTGAEDALTVRVPHSLMALMPEGIRDEETRESVQFTGQGGELVITDVVGKDPVIGIDYIDPALTGKFPITATDIADGAISTPKLSANAIDGMVITGAWVRTGVAPGPRVGLNDPAYPNQIALYSGNADELRPALIQPVLGGANYGTLTLESPALVPDRYAFINMTGYNDGLTAIEAQASNWTMIGTDTTIIGKTSLRLGDGASWITFTGYTISTDDAMSIVAPSVEITGAVTVSGVPAVTTTGAQALTNKDLTGAGNTFPSTLATTATAQTLTNKTLGTGTVLPSTVVQTTGAQTVTGKDLSSGNTFPSTLATTAGAQALTNKDLTGAGNTFPATLLRTTTVQPYAYAHQNANTASWPDGAWTNVTTWTLDSNSGITHSAGTFTVPTAGRYRIFATLTFASVATGVRGVTLVINGTSRAAVFTPLTPGFPTTVQVSMAYVLAANGTIAIQGWQSSGGTTAALRGDAVGTYTNCQIEYVGP